MGRIDYVDLAIRVADQIEKSAIERVDCMTWKRRNKPLGYHLYDGISGIALFFSALYNETNERKYRHLALKTINPLRKENFAYYNGKRNENHSLGIGSGYPAYMYALIVMSQFLQEDMFKHINYYLSFITSEGMSENEHDDILHGLAGTILSLLKVYEVTKNDLALQLAALAGENLIKRQRQNDEQPKRKMLTGFAHGAAGISYALFKLYAVTKNEPLKMGARKYLQYERNVYSVKHHNWPDFRGESIQYLNSWCHGATGIGLARLGSFQYCPDKEMIHEINNVFEKNVNSAYTNVFHLCCGNFGRVEFLLTYVDRYDKTKKEIAHNYLAKLLHHIQFESNVHQLLHDQSLSAGFFLGLSGIGYQFLRMHAPQVYPSILLFE